MKKSVSLMLSLLMVISIITSVPITVSAASVDSLIFELNGDGESYRVDSCDTSAEGELVISSTYNGKPVTQIDSSAFDGCASITSVIIPDSVISVGEYVFQDCTSLVYVKLPVGITSIGSYSFDNCPCLESITIPKGVTSIGWSAFEGCASLESITIPEGVTTIGWSAFEGCSSLTSIVIPDGVTVINSSAFNNCTSLASITIPDSVTSIGYAAFAGTAYYNNSENWENKSLYINNHLIDGGDISGEADIIKEGTKSIAAYAFSYCRSLTSITIPDSVVGIGDRAFTNCENLTSIEVPDSVTSIGEDAFYNTAYYNNSENWVDEVLYIGNHLIEAKDTITGACEIKEGTQNIPEKAFEGCTSLTSITIPDSVKNIGDRAFYECTSLETAIIGNGVTGIGESAFYNCTSLTSITIPASVKNIGDRAFYGCTSLESAIIGNGVTRIGERAFYGCTSLESAIIGNGVTGIGESAFYNCTSLTSVVIPDSVTSLGEGAFSNCTSLITLTIGNSVNSIANSAFYNCESLKSVVLPDSVMRVGESSFSYCDSLTSIEIPDSVTSIGDSAFNYCKSLTSLTIGKSVKSIGDSAFSNCYSLTSVVIPDSVTSIGDEAFDYCTSLTSLTIGKSVKSIGAEAFASCESLKSVNISDIGAWCNIDFEGEFSNPLLLGGYLYINGELPVTVEIPEGVTKIPGYTFRENSSLVSVSIPDSVTTIDDYTFYKCRNLSSITIPKDVVSIGEYAFFGCDSLTSVEFPDSLMSIGEDAFYGCDNLVSVTIPTSLTNIGDLAFDNCKKLIAINVSEDNTAYSSLDGVLFNKDKSELIVYPKGKTDASFTIPDTVTSFPNTVFDNSQLTSIRFGSGITSVPFFFSSYLSNLKEIILPVEITSIDNYAFYYCNLSDVYYEGTGEQWSKVTVETGNPGLDNARIHYNVDIENWEEHYGEPVVTTNPTCSINGVLTYTCPCGLEKTAPIECTGEHILSDWIIDEDPTVYKVGSKNKICIECGAVFETATVPQLKCAKPVLKKVYNANSYVKVTWGTVKGADLYRIYRKTGTGDYEYIGSTTDTYFNDKKAGAGKTCRYRIRAKNEAGYSEYSASLAVKHIDEPTINVIANSSYGVLLEWDEITGAQKYNVYRKVSGGKYEYIGATTNINYTDKTVESGTKYYYAIRGKRDDSVSSLSGARSKCYLEAPVLNTPSTTTKGVGLRWSEVTGAEGYMVYRRTVDGDYERITTEKGVSNVTYRDTTAVKGQKYYYRVKAYKSSTYSAYSNTKSNHS